MKKFLLSLLVALFGAVPIFADDVADVKAVIVRDCELQAKGDFADAFALCAPDYRETGSDGETLNYEHTKWIVLSLDGKHPEEFLLLLATYDNKGVMPRAEVIPRIRQFAHDPGFIKGYEAVNPQIVSAMKSAAELRLKTLEFISVKVDGDLAAAVVEHDRLDRKTNARKREIVTISLRKVNGTWMFYRSVSKSK